MTGDLSPIPVAAESRSNVRNERLSSVGDALELFFGKDFLQLLCDLMESHRRLRNNSVEKPDKFWSVAISVTEVKLFIGSLILTLLLKPMDNIRHHT